MKPSFLILSALVVTGLADVSHADDYSLQGTIWGNTTAPGGWYNQTTSSFGLLPGVDDDAQATALCDSPFTSPCGDVYLQDLGSGDPVVAHVRSFDGSGRRLHIGTGAQLWVDSPSVAGGLTMNGGTLSATVSGSFELGPTLIEWGGVANPSVISAGLVNTVTLRKTTEVEGSLEFRGHGSVVNEGLFTQRNSGNTSFYFGFDFQNKNGAVVDLQNDAGFKVFSPDGSMTPGSSAIEFRNEAGAILKKTGGTGVGLDDGVVQLPIINNGLVSVSSGQLVLAGGGIHTGASWQTDGATSTLVLRGQHTVQGTVTASGSGSVQVGDLYGAGSLAVAGTLDNQGTFYQNQSLTIASGGQFLNSGSLYNWGTTTIAAGGMLSGTGYVQVGGVIDNAGTININNASLVLDPTGEVRNSGIFTTNGNGSVSSGVSVGGTFHNMAGGSFSGSLSSSFDGTTTYAVNVVNEGNFVIPVATSSSVGTFTNNAGNLVVNGQLTNEIPGQHLTLLGGILSGSGIINGEIFVGGGPDVAQFNPGNSPGTMTINGNFSLLSGGVLNLEAAPDGFGGVAFDLLAVNGNVFLDGVVNVIVADGVAEADVLNVNFFDFSSCMEGCSITYGDNFAWAFPGRPGSQLNFDSSGLYIASLMPVPEPEAYALMLAGLGLVGWMARRRKG